MAFHVLFKSANFFRIYWKLGNVCKGEKVRQSALDFSKEMEEKLPNVRNFFKLV